MEHKRICDLTPIEFEKYCYDFLNGYAQKEGLQDFKITHNTKLKASDGKYQIDVYLPLKIVQRLDMPKALACDGTEGQ